MTTSKPAPWMAVRGMGVWTAQTDGAQPAVRLPPRLRRRASLLTRMVADVATQAAEQAGISLTGLPVVMGSAYGELVTTIEMLQELETDRLLSPFRFHNSVHNTATGYLSMATENQASCTALAAGNDTVPVVLLEAFAWLADRGGSVLALFADEPLPAAIAPRATSPLAAALVLSAPTGDSTGKVLGWLGELQQHAARHEQGSRAIEVACPCATSLTLVQTLGTLRADEPPVRVALTAGEGPGWSLTVRAVEPT